MYSFQITRPSVPKSVQWISLTFKIASNAFPIAQPISSSTKTIVAQYATLSAKAVA